MTTIESDWKTYSKLIPVWRDRYLQAKNRELIAILNQHEKTPTEQFWNAKKRIDDEAQVLDQCFGYHSRSKMWMSILTMRRYGLIEDGDLSQFSESLRQDVTRCAQVANNGV